MADAFNANFKNMLLYVGKAATQVKGCPMTSIILSELIKWMFDDEKRARELLCKFRENRKRIDEKYVKGQGESLVNPPAISYSDALSRRDRSLFKHIDLFPGRVSSEYKEQIIWFSSFLVSGMDDKYMNHVWKFLTKIDQQAGPVHNSV